MPLIDDILAEIQDPEQKKLLQALPAGVIQAFEKRATMAADANQKIEELGRAKEALSAYEKANEGWKKAKTVLDGAYGEKYDLAEVVKADRARQAEIDRLKAEVAKLAPEAARAAELARQAEGETVDPEKISEMVLGKAKGQFISKEDLTKAINEAMTITKHSVDFGSIPGTIKLLDFANRAYRDYGVDLRADQLAEASARYSGNPNAIELAFNDLTKTAREERAAKAAADAKAKYEADIAAAKREGSESARREYEMSHIQGEDGGGSALGTVPLNSPKPETKLDPATYDPSAGTLANKALVHYRELESGGFKNLQ